MKINKEKIILGATLLYFFSFIFDFFVSVSIFTMDKEYFMQYEANQIFKEALMLNVQSILIVIILLSLPFLLSIIFFTFNRKIENQYLSILFFTLVFTTLVFISGAHIFGGMTWLV